MIIINNTANTTRTGTTNTTAVPQVTAGRPLRPLIIPPSRRLPLPLAQQNTPRQRALPLPPLTYITTEQATEYPRGC